MYIEPLAVAMQNPGTSEVRSEYGIKEMKSSKNVSVMRDYSVCVEKKSSEAIL